MRSVLLKKTNRFAAHKRSGGENLLTVLIPVTAMNSKEMSLQLIFSFASVLFSVGNNTNQYIK